jgi:hypothetical protein
MWEAQSPVAIAWERSVISQSIYAGQRPEERLVQRSCTRTPPMWEAQSPVAIAWERSVTSQSIYAGQRPEERLVQRSCTRTPTLGEFRPQIVDRCRIKGTGPRRIPGVERISCTQSPQGIGLGSRRGSRIRLSGSGRSGCDATVEEGWYPVHSTGIVRLNV